MDEKKDQSRSAPALYPYFSIPVSRNGISSAETLLSCDYLIGRETVRTLNVDGLSDRKINSLAEIVAIMKEKK